MQSIFNLQFSVYFLRNKQHQHHQQLHQFAIHTHETLLKSVHVLAAFVKTQVDTQVKSVYLYRPISQITNSPQGALQSVTTHDTGHRK